MGPSLLLLASVVGLFALPKPQEVQATPASYFDDDGDGFEDYSEGEIEDILNPAQKRSSWIYVYRRACVRRGGNCDHRPGDCCYNSTCRCNLWGANCRCQRKGIFQKWGK